MDVHLTSTWSSSCDDHLRPFFAWLRACRLANQSDCDDAISALQPGTYGKLNPAQVRRHAHAHAHTRRLCCCGCVGVCWRLLVLLGVR